MPRRAKERKPKDCKWSEKKYDRCVDGVEKGKNPYAICSASCLGTTKHNK